MHDHSQLHYDRYPGFRYCISLPAPLSGQWDLFLWKGCPIQPNIAVIVSFVYVYPCMVGLQDQLIANDLKSPRLVVARMYQFMSFCVTQHSQHNQPLIQALLRGTLSCIDYFCGSGTAEAKGYFTRVGGGCLVLLRLYMEQSAFKPRANLFLFFPAALGHHRNKISGFCLIPLSYMMSDNMQSQSSPNRTQACKLTVSEQFS